MLVLNEGYDLDTERGAYFWLVLLLFFFHRERHKHIVPSLDRCKQGVETRNKITDGALTGQVLLRYHAKKTSGAAKQKLDPQLHPVTWDTICVVIVPSATQYTTQLFLCVDMTGLTCLWLTFAVEPMSSQSSHHGQ